MGDRFTVRVEVRGYEQDANGHVNHANYHRYGEVARMAFLREAGCSIARLGAAGLGVVLLETHARFLRELVEGDVVEIGCAATFGTGKTFTIEHELVRVGQRDEAAADPVPACEISCRLGVLDHATRRLVADPRGRLGEVATRPGLLLGA